MWQVPDPFVVVELMNAGPPVMARSSTVKKEQSPKFEDGEMVKTASEPSGNTLERCKSFYLSAKARHGAIQHGQGGAVSQIRGRRDGNPLLPKVDRGSTFALICPHSRRLSR